MVIAQSKVEEGGVSVEPGSGWSVRMSGVWVVSGGQEVAQVGDRVIAGYQLTGCALLSITGGLSWAVAGRGARALDGP